jgi:hypothetical protein
VFTVRPNRGLVDETPKSPPDALQAIQGHRVIAQEVEDEEQRFVRELVQRAVLAVVHLGRYQGVHRALQVIQFLLLTGFILLNSTSFTSGQGWEERYYPSLWNAHSHRRCQEDGGAGGRCVEQDNGLTRVVFPILMPVIDIFMSLVCWSTR